MSIDARTKQQYAKVFGDWKIGELLGQGSQGKSSVYRITKSNYTYEEVGALKVMNIVEQRGRYKQLPETLRTEYDKNCKDAKRKAENEIQLMYKLKNNKHIVRYLEHHFESWEDENGYGVDLLIRMDFYQNLGNIMAQGKVYMEDEVKKVGMDICLALIACHKERILHRDIKPDNIFRENDGNYLLGDFGVSRYTENSLEAETMTGSYPYAAPEQMGAFGVNNYDGRVDIYSLGLTLYELANGNCRPFSSSPMDKKMENIKKRLVGKKIPKPSEVSDALSEIILKACEYKPQDRYQTVNEFYQALMDITEEKKIFKPEICMEGLEKENGFNIDETIPAENGSLNIEYSDETLPAHGKYRDSDVVLEFTEQEKSGSNKVGIFDRIFDKTGDKEYELGKKYYYGEGVEKNSDKAWKLLKKSEKKGNEKAKNLLKDYLEMKKEELDNMFLAPTKKLAEQGDKKAQCDLAHWFCARKNYKEAVKWFKLSAEKGSSEAMCGLGERYLYGEGVDQDYKKAIEWIKLSAEQGEWNAQYRLGECYYYGNGVEKNSEEAVKWYRKSAKQKHITAQRRLGECYYRGEGIKRDYKEAAKWWRESAEQGDSEAMYHIGLCYSLGTGVTKDNKKAVEWFKLSAKIGNKKAQDLLTHHEGIG